MGTYEGLLLLCECRWGRDRTCRWWGHLTTICCHRTFSTRKWWGTLKPSITCPSRARPLAPRERATWWNFHYLIFTDVDFLTFCFRLSELTHKSSISIIVLWCVLVFHLTALWHVCCIESISGRHDVSIPNTVIRFNWGNRINAPTFSCQAPWWFLPLHNT